MKTIAEDIWIMMDELRKGVEKDQRIIADLKFRKAELERMLLEARRRRDAGRGQCIAELERDFATAKGGDDAFSRGWDGGFQDAIYILKARR